MARRTRLTWVMAVLVAFAALAAPVRLAGAAELSAQAQYVIDLIDGVAEEMCFSDYWAERQTSPSATEVLATTEQIEELNAAILATSGTNMYDLKNYPETIDGVATNQGLIASAQSDLDYFFIWNVYDANGIQKTKADFDSVIANCNNPKATENQAVKYAVAVERTELLSLPTDELMTDDPDQLDFNNNSLGGICVNEPVIITSTSADGEWYACVTSNCPGWVKASDVAVCASKDEWLEAWDIPADETLVVCTSRMNTVYTNNAPNVSNRMLTLGTHLRLATADDYSATETSFGGRAAYNNYVVWLPVRGDDGSYSRELALVSQSENVHAGYLELTCQNVVEVALDSLGYRYGWGGMLYASDCTGYMRNVYRCFGLELPRNTTWQPKIPTKKYSLSDMTDEEKLAVLDGVPAGTLLYFSGHGMIYLGHEGDEYYVISDVGFLVNPSSGNVQALKSIVINPLSVLRANGNSWLTSLTDAVIPFWGENDINYYLDAGLGLEESYVYTASAIESDVTAALTEAGLVAGTDYTVAYTDNVEVGTATVTVTGTGDYTGSISATFEIVHRATAESFSDFDASAWYLSESDGAFSGLKTLYMDDVLAKGLMSGYSTSGTFGPDDRLTRAQAATIIYRAANPGSTDTTVEANYAKANTTGLSDVATGTWYTAAANWCIANNIMTGYKGEDGSYVAFGPDDEITREQLATIVCRWCTSAKGLPSASADLSSFSDEDKISSWARDGLSYCLAKGIISGYGGTALCGPQDPTTRCQMAKIIAVAVRLVESGA